MAATDTTTGAFTARLFAIFEQAEFVYCDDELMEDCEVRDGLLRLRSDEDSRENFFVRDQDVLVVDGCCEAVEAMKGVFEPSVLHLKFRRTCAVCATDLEPAAESTSPPVSANGSPAVRVKNQRPWTLRDGLIWDANGALVIGADEEIVAAINAECQPAQPAQPSSFKAMLFDLIEQADRVVCDGYEIDEFNDYEADLMRLGQGEDTQFFFKNVEVTVENGECVVEESFPSDMDADDEGPRMLRLEFTVSHPIAAVDMPQKQAEMN